LCENVVKLLAQLGNRCRITWLNSGPKLE